MSSKPQWLPGITGSIKARSLVSCPRCRLRASLAGPRVQQSHHKRYQHQEASLGTSSYAVPFRKRLKEEARLRKESKIDDKTSRNAGCNGDTDPRLERWELTVGIEIHAQLNTRRKLFSRAPTSFNDDPNTNVALFDLSLPGSQPIFQKATLLPAIRAALALNCSIQRTSSFDRKHYFYQDQPAGYQITQYYAPFAKDGFIKLYNRDGVPIEEGEEVTVGIKQIQMEQDTAKTIQQPPNIALLDFNRVGHPLIEIITLPQIHSPQTAAACVRKIQGVLQAVNAVTTGMELGGLRADVNVSVKPCQTSLSGLSSQLGEANHSYSGVTGLGQRTEIKNLSSFKAIEDAIIAERNRQIDVLEAGGKVEGETRGWTLGSTETTRLRGKEGEVDYRYMPDPDIAPVIVAQDLVDHLRDTLPETPDQSIKRLMADHGLNVQTAEALTTLDDGLRLDYFDEAIVTDIGGDAQGVTQTPAQSFAPLLANWVTHEVSALISKTLPPIPFTTFSARLPPSTLSLLVHTLAQSRITSPTAKYLLSQLSLPEETRTLDQIIKEEDLALEMLSDDEYEKLATDLVDKNEEMAGKVRKDWKGGKTKSAEGKMRWFVGQMVKSGGGKVEAKRAEGLLRKVLGMES
ncbi:hypothetical protein MMC25_002341 [Agyrium rufum]|nr:hypothetical protein [Agyrium rufum]